MEQNINNAYSLAQEFERKGEIMNAIRALDKEPTPANRYYQAKLYVEIGDWRKTHKILQDPEVKAAAGAEYQEFFVESKNRVKDSNAATLMFFGISFISGFIIFYSTDAMSGGRFPSNHTINYAFLGIGAFFTLWGTILKWVVNYKK